MSKKYEYEIKISPGSQWLQQMLNDMGAKGWRVVSTDLRCADEKPVILFEREIE